MNTKDLNDFKLLFENMKDQLISKAKLKDANLAHLSNGDIVEQTSNERDIQVLLKLQGRDRFLMMKIEHALDKIDNGTFGQCEECDGDISMNRLLARPIATHCICCKEELEKEEKQIDYQKRSKTNGKVLNNTNANIITFPGDNLVAEGTAQVNLSKWQQKYEEKRLSNS
jgi:DnaK suppressor protein